MTLFAAFNILSELRVHPITQADYGYRSNWGQDSSTSEEIGGSREHFVDLFAIELWTVTPVTVCLVKSNAVIARKMELSERESTAVENMGAPRRALLSSSA